MKPRDPLENLRQGMLAQHRSCPFSGVIDIRREGEGLISQAFGFANFPEKIPNTLHTRFGIASGGKGFTAVAICRLVERGLLRFDTRLKDCLPEGLAEFDPAITLHHLLTHSSGVPDYFDEEESDDYEAVWKTNPAYTFRRPADYLPLFAHLPRKFSPGERFSYSNSGFILLALVIEHLTGQPFAQVIEEDVFKPAVMARSGYFPLDQLPEGTALGYIPCGEGDWRSNIYAVPILGGGDGGAFTTAADMANFWKSLLDQRLIQKTTLEVMLSPQIPTIPRNQRIYYGYGMWMRIKKGHPVEYYLIGEDPGVAFYSGYFPESRVIFSLFGNTSEPAFRMLKELLPLVRSLS
jgi:CubicO group peptidase (beta-lactamase class C family)